MVFVTIDMERAWYCTVFSIGKGLTEDGEISFRLYKLKIPFESNKWYLQNQRKTKKMIANVTVSISSSKCGEPMILTEMVASISASGSMYLSCSDSRSLFVFSEYTSYILTKFEEITWLLMSVRVSFLLNGWWINFLWARYLFHR